ncbi:MAG: AI-2E family transporter [Desulfobulbaceae bacterium]|nr:AI-2E family transporter [Desulfobulbaceae bacterium]
MNSSNQSSNDKLFIARALEATIHIGLVVLILYWCFRIGQPFIEIIVWGIIIAVAIHPGYDRLKSALGGRVPLLSAAAGAGVGILKFVVSIIIAGVLLANADGGGQTARAIAVRLAGERGTKAVELARATVRSVTLGILGVALIQALLSGIGFLVVGVPGAGLWALLVLILAVVQLPPLLVLGPIIVYVFSTTSAVTAVVFAIWSVLVGISDPFLKPVLMGRGVDVPMLVIFIGAIGGLWHRASSASSLARSFSRSVTSFF